MFSLERNEKYIVLLLTVTLVLGLAIAAYSKSRAGQPIKIERFTVDAAMRRAPAGGSFEKSRININTAGVEELMKLRGVGKILAQRVIDYRSTKGIFVITDDIKKVEGIGPALYSKIKDEISVE